MTLAAGIGLTPARTALDNGTIVLAKQTTTTPAVTIHAMFAAGSVNEPASLPGTAYFVGRMLDRGTDRVSADDLAEELDNRGVSIHIKVKSHVTTIAVDCLVDDFETVLALVAGVVIHPAFPEEQIALRRREILTRLRQDEDNPAARASDALYPLLYGPGHPYSRRRRGIAASVTAITRDDLVRFHRSHFDPAGLSIAIVGDVDPDRATEAAGDLFGGWRTDVERSAPQFPSVPRRGSRVVDVIPMPNKAQADIAYGFVTVSRTDPAFYDYWVMNTILGQYGLGGRIGDDVRERQGLAYYAYSSFDPHIVPGPLIVRAGVDGANVDRALATIDRNITAMAAEGPTAEELADTKRFLIGSLPRMLETNAGIAFFLQTIEEFGLGLDYDVRLPALIEEVTRDGAHAAASGLSPEHAAVAIAGPYSAPGTREDAP
jgi:zinc protease